jgi:hypothetical protein
MALGRCLAKGDAYPDAYPDMSFLSPATTTTITTTTTTMQQRMRSASSIASHIHILLSLHLVPRLDLTMPPNAGQLLTLPLSTFVLLSLLCKLIACHFPHSYRCLSSLWNADLSVPHVLARLTHPNLSRFQWYVDSCASVETWRLCMRRADSDLNPNLISVFIVSMAQ